MMDSPYGGDSANAEGHSNSKIYGGDIFPALSTFIIAFCGKLVNTQAIFLRYFAKLY
jgi:hypothetical protein